MQGHLVTLGPWQEASSSQTQGHKTERDTRRHRPSIIRPQLGQFTHANILRSNGGLRKGWVINTMRAQSVMCPCELGQP